MKFTAQFIFRYSIALILAAGLFWTALNLLRADELRQRMAAKLETIKQLREFKAKQDSIEASFKALAALPANAAPSLAVLASSTVTGLVAEVRELDSRSLGQGWTARRAEVSFPEVNLNLLAGFLGAAESQRPPWRLAECVITSSQKADGFGSAKLTMETVTRADTKP